MPEEQEQFARAVERMLDAVMFENWVRFYFLQEAENDPDRLFVAIPEKGMDRIREMFPDFVPMAEALNGREMTLEVSREAVCGFIHDTLEGSLIPEGSMAAYFDTHAFQASLQLFNVWVQAYEKLLDETFLDFGRWREEFAKWRASEHGKQIEDELLAGMRRSEH